MLSAGFAEFFQLKLSLHRLRLVGVVVYILAILALHFYVRFLFSSHRIKLKCKYQKLK
jgi:phage shock protein PspC (stress-responsive transcriptional regulator)